VPIGDQNGDGAKPTVLSKLQKWVCCNLKLMYSYRKKTLDLISSRLDNTMPLFNPSVFVDAPSLICCSFFNSPMQADYPSVGNPVTPTNFIPMKTPMSLEIISNWSLEEPPKYSHTIPELFSSQQGTGRCVGMIIDLANHECLYAEDLPESLEYTHIQLVAKVLPPLQAINAVAAAAAEFWARRPNDYIAIHCAYGFNRTGFVVCSYLCQECGMTVPEALESFAQARPPGVKHGKFVDELYARYGTLRTHDNPNPNDSTSTSTIFSGTEQLEKLQEHTREGIHQTRTSPAAEAEPTATAGIYGKGQCDLRPPASSFPGGAAPLSGLLSTHLRKGSISNSINSTGSTPVRGNSFFLERKSLDGGSGGGGGTWKEERKNIITNATSDDEYALSITSLSLSTGASMGSPTNSITISIPSSLSARGSLVLGGGSAGDGGSRRSSSRSLLAVHEVREEKEKHIRMKSGVEEDPATATIDDEKNVDVDDFIEPRTSGQWSEMAQQVDGKSLMRRETSLGLAKALHEDFGVHESTPSGLAPSPLIKKLEAEEEAEARAEEDAAGITDTNNLIVEDQVRKLNLENSEESILDGIGGDQGQQCAFATRHQEDQEVLQKSAQHESQFNAEIPSSTPPSATSLQQQQYLRAAQTFQQDGGKIAAVQTTESSNVLPAGSTADLYMSRSMSYESDCHSLGFNAREATTQLRLHQAGGGGVLTDSGPGVNPSFNRQYSIASDLDSTLWETSEDEGGRDGVAGNLKGKSRRQLPQEQRRDCAVM
jgi:protein-tyrosine phosphatase